MADKEIIKWLQSLKSEIGKQSNQHLWNYEEALDTAIKALAKDEWIPVSERLPSDSGNYLITVADLRLGHNGEHTVTMADFYAKAKKWNSIVDVYAWMPLPDA